MLHGIAITRPWGRRAETPETGLRCVQSSGGPKQRRERQPLKSGPFRPRKRTSNRFPSIKGFFLDQALPTEGAAAMGRSAAPGMIKATIPAVGERRNGLPAAFHRHGPVLRAHRSASIRPSWTSSRATHLAQSARRSRAVMLPDFGAPFSTARFAHLARV